jgi:hypothetical protein
MTSRPLNGRGRRGGRLGSKVEPTVPSAEELAAIVAAVELVWPKPAPARLVLPVDASAWRWSGRWWGTRHVVADRRRPW